MTDVVVVAAVRSPFGRRGGGLAGLHPVDLLGSILGALAERSGVDPATVGQVVGGCVEKAGEQAFNVTRTAWLSAGLPSAVPASTIDAQCGSAQQAFTAAYALVAAGIVDSAVACGVESMSRVPMATTFTSGPGEPISPSFLERYPFPDQFASAEAIAASWGVTREDCDALALRSNARALAARDAGHGAAGLAAVAGVVADETIRVAPPEKLAGLPTLRDGAVHTAATASKIADGAAALLLMDADRAAADGVAPLARVVDSVLVGVEPDQMLTGPIPATATLLTRNGLKIEDIDVVEINEAFASVVLAWAAETKVDMDRVNPNGGALAHGHPVGATGAGLLVKAVHELRRIDGSLGLVTMCCGGGLGTGTLLQRI